MAAVIKSPVPPLEFGDRLTRAEFLRRWEDHPEIKKAELIGGMVYTSSKVTVQHGVMKCALNGWLGVYATATPGTQGSSNATTFLLDDTVQPAVSLRILTEHGGGSWVEDDSFLHGTPELLAEICESSASYNLHVKCDLYWDAQVPEYLAILLYEKEIRWHVLVDGQYQLLAPDADGIWRSRVFPGLWLDGKALLARNDKQVLARLNEGLLSPEHQAFVARLAQQRKS